jgi:hypothetical protein
MEASKYTTQVKKLFICSSRPLIRAVGVGTGYADEVTMALRPWFGADRIIAGVHPLDVVAAWLTCGSKLFSQRWGDESLLADLSERAYFAHSAGPISIAWNTGLTGPRVIGIVARDNNCRKQPMSPKLHGLFTGMLSAMGDLSPTEIPSCRTIRWMAKQCARQFTEFVGAAHSSRRPPNRLTAFLATNLHRLGLRCWRYTVHGPRRPIVTWQIVWSSHLICEPAENRNTPDSCCRASIYGQ